jgi:hypothetical protein
MKRLLAKLTAIALSVAMVSTVDARQRIAVPVARDMNAATKRIVNIKAAKEDKDAALDELVAIFKENPDELQLAQLFVLRKQKENEVSAKKDEIAAMNVGWFDFNNVDYKRAKGQLATLTTELKNLNQEIANQAKVVGPEMSKAVKFAIGGAIAAAGLFAVDVYLGGKVRKAAMERVGKVWEATAPARERVGQYYEQTTTAIRKRLPESLGGIPATPTIPEPEYR